MTIRATSARMSAYSTMPCPVCGRWGSIIPNLRIKLSLATISTPRVVVAHGSDDVGVKVDDLAASCDQGDDDDQGDQSKDEGVFDHALSCLQRCYVHHPWC